MIDRYEGPQDPGNRFEQGERRLGRRYDQSNILQKVEQGLFDVKTAADSQGRLPEELICI
jgi:hypothetical protein